MSSIYIKDMEMPKIGESVTIYPDGRVVSYDTYSGGTIRGKAIHVPDHGRLGDLDATEKLFRGMGAEVWADAADIIAEAPTIIPASKEET